MAGQLNWVAISSDSTGAYLVAVGKYTYVWTSNDHGATWIEQVGSLALYWWDIACDSTCQNIYLVVRDGGNIHTSHDYGVSWQPQVSSGSRLWVSVAVDATGQYAAAVEYNGYIYTCSDYGMTWIQQMMVEVRFWAAICMDSTGRYVVAVDDGQGAGGKVHTSYDGGVTWIAQSGSYVQDYSDIVSDSSGRYLTATARNGFIYTSVNYGVNWTEQLSAGKRNWYSVASGSTGKYLAAVVYGDGGYIYTSSDYGKEWIVADSRSSEDDGLNADETGYVVAGAVGLMLIIIALLLLYYFRYYHRVHKAAASSTSETRASSAAAASDITTASNTNINNAGRSESLERKVVSSSIKYRRFLDQSDEECYPFDLHDNDEQYITNPLTAYRHKDDDETDHILSILKQDEYAEFCYDDAVGGLDDGFDDGSEDEDFDYHSSTGIDQPMKTLRSSSHVHAIRRFA